MPVTAQPGESDLFLPLPEQGEHMDPYTVLTHYFGLTVPQAGIGAYIYLRCQPAFGLAQGGISLFHGLDNTTLLDAAYHDYRATMPWPAVNGNTISVANGLTIEATVPGQVINLRYTSADGSTWIDVEQRAVTPLLSRGHIIPGEEDHHDRGSTRSPGGIEQFMHVTGAISLRGQHHEVNCLHVRDRSWLQVRGEAPGGVRKHPPLAWTPICFGEELALNATSIEAKDTNPAWLDVYDLPDDSPTHHASWVVRNGESREIVSVRRNVLEYHPTQHAALRQELQATDETGESYHFTGEAISMSAMHSWPNIAFHDSVYRWTDDAGRQTHCTFQEIWYDDYQHAMQRRIHR